MNLLIKEPNRTNDIQKIKKDQCILRAGIKEQIDPRIIKTIDIYIPAGLNEVELHGKTIKSCNRKNNWNCGIYKVTWDFI